MSNQTSLKVVNELNSMDKSASQIEIVLQQKTLELQECQKYGNYVKADEIKADIEKLKKDLNQKKFHQIIQNQKRQKKRLQKMNEQEHTQLSANWAKKLQDYNCQKASLKKQMQQRHNNQVLKAKSQLEAQVSTKMKQSSECLNFRKIQEQMKKQKKYSEAHQIQQQVIQMQIKEKINFEKQRQLNIQTALGTLKAKFRTQVEALNKKISSGEKELVKEKEKQIQRAKLKHTNSIKQLISHQQKQLLGQKGLIKSRVTLSSCRSRTKFTSLRKN